MGPRVRLSPAALGGYAILALLALLYLIPLMFVFFVSLMSSRQFALNAASFPDPVLWSNYPEAWIKGSFGTYFVNSLFYTFTIVFGSLISEALSIYGVIPEGSLLSQQWEYLDLPRLWQILLVVGMFLWIVIVWRGMRPRLVGESKLNMPWLFLFAGLAIPAFYAVGLLASSDTHFSVADFCSAASVGSNSSGPEAPSPAARRADRPRAPQRSAPAFQDR